LRPLLKGFRALKTQFKIPQDVELKWSPDRKHYLRTKLKDRTGLYLAVLKLLIKHNVRCLCAIHHLQECYGMKLHGWTIDQAKSWAAKTQIEWLAERFQSPLLVRTSSKGLLIIDRMSHGTDEKETIRSLEADLLYGTGYQQLTNITLNLMPADSCICAPLELADLIIGVAVSWFGGGKWSEPLFPELIPQFLYKYYEQANVKFAANPSTVILGYGLKLFPDTLLKTGRKRFKELDERFLFTETGVCEWVPF